MHQEPSFEAAERALGHEPRRDTTPRVFLSGIIFTSSARETLGKTVKDIAATLDLPLKTFFANLFWEIYWKTETGSLVVIMRSECMESDVSVEIASDQWEFKTRSSELH